MHIVPIKRGGGGGGRGGGQGRNYPWTRRAMAPTKILRKEILLYIYVLILVILLYKITFYFPLTISLIILKVMLYSKTFL